jgi:serine/threonine-protein kinase
MLHFICLLFALNYPTQAKWITFKDSLGRYSLEYPANWEQVYIQGATGFVSPFENDSDDFRENVNVMIQSLKNPMTLAEYTAMSKKQYTDAYGPKAVISMKDTTFCGYNATKGVFAIMYGDKDIKLQQIWYIKNNSAYLITFTAEPKTYEKYLPTAERITGSFKMGGR